MKSIAFTSGKGGVGKTTIALNLGLLLAAQGRRVTVVDADLQMANLGILLGVDSTPITLNNVLSGDNTIKDAVYAGPKGLKYVPAGLSSDSLNKVDYSKLPETMRALSADNEFVLIDSPPGLGEDARAAAKAADELIIVMTPEPSSLADALKVKIMSERIGTQIKGIVLNMSYGDKSEINPRDLSTVMEVPIIAVLPDDREVRRSNALQQPVVLRAPKSAFVKALGVVARFVLGESAPAAPPTKQRKGIGASLMAFIRRLFGKR